MEREFKRCAGRVVKSISAFYISKGNNLRLTLFKKSVKHKDKIAPFTKYHELFC